jgi:hypothetical protein
MSIPESLRNTELFSKYQGSINALYETDEDFRTLCDDYVASKTNMEKYNGRLKEDVQRKLEYENLTIELEKEIFRYIKK